MNLERTLAIMALFIAFLALFTALNKAHAADLPLPKLRPERCLVTGEEPSTGQTLHVDKRCKSGLRWVYQR